MTAVKITSYIPWKLKIMAIRTIFFLITRVIQNCIPKSFLSAELRKNRNTELQTRNRLRSALGGYTQAENARSGYKSDKVIYRVILKFAGSELWDVIPNIVHYLEG
jgi:hypothetical protein